MPESFSSEARRELCENVRQAKHCCVAEISAFINGRGVAGESGLAITIENEFAARHFQSLLSKAFGFEGRYLTSGHGHPHNAVVIEDAPKAEILLAAVNELNAAPPHGLPNCCKRAYIRGSFIALGTVSDPNKTYHLEFSFPISTGQLPVKRLRALLRSFGIRPRAAGRKTHTLVYVKEAEEITDLFNIMEAHKTLLKLENVRILKGISNSVNRRVNFETANLSKTVKASVKQLEDIRYIDAAVGLGFLSGNLEETARLRLAHESASLKEIGAMLNPPVGKSGVNHRLRKISEIAGQLKEE